MTEGFKAILIPFSIVGERIFIIESGNMESDVVLHMGCGPGKLQWYQIVRESQIKYPLPVQEHPLKLFLVWDL